MPIDSFLRAVAALKQDLLKVMSFEADKAILELLNRRWSFRNSRNTSQVHRFWDGGGPVENKVMVNLTVCLSLTHGLMDGYTGFWQCEPEAELDGGAPQASREVLV